jgi:hypothetical protein
LRGKKTKQNKTKKPDFSSFSLSLPVAQAQAPLETIRLARCSVVRCEKKETKKDVSFKLIHPKDEKKMKEFFFAPATPDEQAAWLKALQESIVFANPQLFGIDLRLAIFKCADPIPMVVRLCFNYLAAHFKSEGLFRISGQAAQVAAWKEAFDNAGDKFPDLSSCHDPHIITTLVKLYFRELPNPLCTFPLYPLFIDASKKPSQRQQVVAVQALLERMPIEHRNTLQLLLHFLRDVAGHADENKMSTPNLAAVFGPTILRAHQPSAADASNNENIVAITCTMIKYWDACYGVVDIGAVPETAGDALPAGAAAPVSDAVEQQLAAHSAATAAALASAQSAAIVDTGDDEPEHDDAGGGAGPAEPADEPTARAAPAEPAPPAGEGEKKKPVWKEYKTKEGKTYYYNSETKKTQWTRPPEMDDDGAPPTEAAPPRHVGPQFKLDPSAVQLKKRDPAPARTQPAAAPVTRVAVAPPTRGPAPVVAAAPTPTPAPAAVVTPAAPVAAPVAAAAAAPVNPTPAPQPVGAPTPLANPVRRANVAPPSVGTQPDVRRPKLPPGAVAIGGPPVAIGMTSPGRESAGSAPTLSQGGGGDEDARLTALEEHLRELEEKQDENAALLTRILEVLGS